MNSKQPPDALTTKTIDDFGEQWALYTENSGWYGSLALFENIINPLLTAQDLQGQTVVDIGSGTGRIVSMLLQAGVARVYAIEPAAGAFQTLQQNITKLPHPEAVIVLNQRGDAWQLQEAVDTVVSIGVIHHIPDPAPVVAAAFRALKPNGTVFIWVYGYEGNEWYLRVFQPLRQLTMRLPHWALRGLVEMLYGTLWGYYQVSKLAPLPLKSYLQTVLWPMSPQNRRLVIYDQLNPAYAKYYRRQEVLDLLEQAGFQNIRLHHRQGYSWSAKGTKCE